MYEIVKVCQRTTFEAIRPEVTCESIYLVEKAVLDDPVVRQILQC